MRVIKINLIILITLAISLANCSHNKTKILIIGDSISIGYTPFVRENMVNKAEVFHNPGNAQHTATGLEKIEEWIGTENYDIIQFNWGLWDLCYRHPDSKVQGNRDKINGEITFSIDEYASNLDSIVTLLTKKTKAKLIFVTTSYVPENEAGRFKEDAIRYNDIAKKIMIRHDVTVNDIYEETILIHNECSKDTNDVHYTLAGYEKIGKLISDFLENEMQR
jgi:lysophospholipase L1-like esterase